MIPLTIHMNAEGAYIGTPDAKHGMMTDIGFLENGTVKGNPSIAVRAKLDDGTVVIIETTWALLHNAHIAFAARYGVPT